MKYSSLKPLLSDIANAIREHNGEDELIVAEEFPEKIKSLPKDNIYNIYTSESLEQVCSKDENIGKLYRYVGPTTEKYANNNIYEIGKTFFGKSDLFNTYTDWDYGRQIVYGNGKYLLFQYGNTNEVLYSENKKNWTPIYLPIEDSGHWIGCFGDGQFVALGRNSSKEPVALYSTDGINWTLGQVSFTESFKTQNNIDFQDICFGNGHFVAIISKAGIINGNDSINFAYYSDDGKRWQEVTLPIAQNWTSISYGNSKFIFFAENSNKIVVFKGDSVLEQKTLPISGNWYATTYGNGKFVAINGGKDRGVAQTKIEILYSYNGDEWEQTECALPYGDHSYIRDRKVVYWIEDVAYGNNMFLACGDFNIYSIDGIKWYSSILENRIDVFEEWSNLCFDGENFIATNEMTNVAVLNLENIPIYHKTDETDYPTIKTVDELKLLSSNIGWNTDSYNDYFRMENYLFKPATSISSVQLTYDTNQIGCVCSGNDKIIGISYSTNSPKFVYSIDGINWNEGTCDIELEKSCGYLTLYKNNVYFAFWTCGRGSADMENALNAIYFYSTDGINWIKGSLPINKTSNGYYGYKNVICTDNEVFLFYENNLINDINTKKYFITKTTDGINWSSPIEVADDDYFQSYYTEAAYGNGKIIIIDEETGAGVYSTDGQNWIEFNTQLGIEASQLTFINGEFVLTGIYTNLKIAHSIDGINWSYEFVPNLLRQSSYSNARISYINNFYFLTLTSVSRTKNNTYYTDIYISEDRKSWVPYCVETIEHVSGNNYLTFYKNKLYLSSNATLGPSVQIDLSDIDSLPFAYNTQIFEKIKIWDFIDKSPNRSHGDNNMVLFKGMSGGEPIILQNKIQGFEDESVAYYEYKISNHYLNTI